MTLILLLLCSYLLGNILTGSIISSFFYKKNIRVEGSGNPGARNAGRVFGKKAFVATFIGDALKGVLAVCAAKWLGFGADVEILALFAVTLGHVYPLFLKFRGGMGVSTYIGGMLVFNPLLFLVFMGLYLIIYPFVKSFTLAGLSAVLLMPIIVLAFLYEIPVFIAACLLSTLLLFTHWPDLKQKIMPGKS
ncbi:glycerol-3-phosphate acyltransferase [Sporosarcina sp. ANT_H38]|uniref:glycerol-3-phosphate acyltransferase n=1 Tax=Sporosarcina sp. ANT_H38 TaxID=2597358 RepID=UPI0011F3E214|nr:glycerol-3-phosphate acyltransferase [Sporosarcina sp. ANT_H38]KAA0948737.1 glycerol-3-phosphate acyltransferase [Sporosarcina sp. ANT_H38]